MHGINEETIKDILRNREEKQKNIHHKMLRLYKELADTDDLIRSVALPASEISDMPAGKNEKRDTGDILLRYQRQLKERNKEIRQLMWGLAQEEESISRVWNCFYALGDPYYAILYALYVENQVYQSVEASFGSSHKTFEKKRKHGISLIMQFYESSLTAGELICQAQKARKPKKAKVKEKTYHQLSLQELIGD